MSVNRKVTVPVGNDAEASRTADTLSVGPLLGRPGSPIVEPRLRKLGGEFRGAPNAKADARAHDGAAHHHHQERTPCPPQPSPPKPLFPKRSLPPPRSPSPPP